MMTGGTPMFGNHRLVISHSYGKSHVLIGKPSINDPVFIAMLVYQRVSIVILGSPTITKKKKRKTVNDRKF